MECVLSRTTVNVTTALPTRALITGLCAGTVWGKHVMG